MKSITFKTNVATTGAASAEIVNELPELGDTFHGHIVLEAGPFPLVDDQDDHEVYQFAIWRLHLSGNIYDYVAIHEAEAEKI